jgi:hypothetical protein
MFEKNFRVLMALEIKKRFRAKGSGCQVSGVRAKGSMERG